MVSNDTQNLELREPAKLRDYVQSYQRESESENHT